MVTFRRAVRTEEDRAGGYGLAPIRRSETSAVTEDFSASVERDIETNVREYERAYSGVEIEDPIETFTRGKKAKEFSYSERSDYPQTAEYVGYAVSAPVRVKKSPKRPKEDFMPSIAIRREQKVESQTANEVKRREKPKTSSKSKAMLMLYMGIATVIAIVVMALNVVIGNMTADVAALESAVSQRQEIVYQQNAEIAHLTDADYIAGVALTDNGMEKVSATATVTLVELDDPVTYEARTNWFDRFCDWLSGIIGG